MSALASTAFVGDDDDESFYLASPRIYSPDDKQIAVEFGGQFRKGMTLQMNAYRIVDPVAFFLAQEQIHSPVLADSGGSAPARRSDVADKRHYTSVASWTVKVDPESRYWHRESLPVPVREKGVYLVTARNRGKEATTVVVITELGMITKQSSSEALAFVVDRRSGQKATGVPLRFLQTGGTAEAATTGGDGVARIATTTADNAGDDGMRMGSRWGGHGNNMVVLGEKDGNLVISDSYFYANYGNGGSGMSIYLHTDRPVYRPSQEVNFRGIARQIEKDGTYSNVTDSLVAIEVTDARGSSIFKDTTRLSGFGTFNGTLTLGDEPPLGDYNIKVAVEGTEMWFRFAVEEYKKPEYEVKVLTGKDQYTRGDKISATIKADYYFGSPVTEATVEYFVFRTRYYRPWWHGSEWAYLYDTREMDYGGQMEMVHNGSGKLKADGTYQIDYQTDAKSDEDWVYRIQANVVDNSRRSIIGSTSVRVTRGEFHITAWTDRYVYSPGDKALIKVRTARFSDDKGVAASFTATVKRTWWENRGRRGGTSQNETVWTGSGSTDGNGNGQVSFTPEKAGYFTVEVKAKDARGTEIGTSTSVYVADESYAAWYREGAGDVQIIPDKALYTPGETMSALVIVPEAGFDLLTTIEGATIYRHSVERLGSTAAIIRVPIDEKFAPMVYMSASGIVGDRFHSAEQRISVIPKGKKIRIEVTTDKPVYKPGESAVVKIRALLDNGEPAPATDIALGMVDEAIYAIRPDQTPDITSHFYGVRHNAVNTATSLNFNFYWNQAQNAPSMMASGEFPMMESDAMAPQSRAVNMAKLAPPPPPMAPGADAYLEPVLRTEFKDMMFWTPSVRTGSDGRATLDVKFPDNLTTWRITARGVTQATAVGQTTASVIARKDLLVRMETPRFLTEGDELVIATTVHNYLSTEKQTKVEFAGEGFEMASSTQTVMIPANGEKRIDWKMKAPKIGQATMRVRALTNEESDAMELKVPILPRGLRLATSQMVGIEQQTGSHSMSLNIPTNTVPGSSTMTLAISPSAASSIIGALDALIGYPYGCVEQTMSRFLPTVVVADALKKLDVPFDAVKRDELPKMVAKGFERLGELQHSDGGWGWWTNDETNPFMTAYVMYGMTVARDAGYAADADRYARGVSALHTLIKSKAAEKEMTTRAYMLYVASYIGEKSGDRSYVDEIATLSMKKDLNNYGKALLALAAMHANDRALAGRIASELEKGATTTENAVYWKGQSWHYQWQDDEVETTAYVVKALLAIRGETDQVGRAVQWLLKQKEGDSWHNTRQTAMTIFALVDYVQRTKELDPGYDLAISVNGQRVYTHRMTKADVFAPEKTIAVDPKILRNGDNTVTIEKSGAGKLYTSARLVYYATGDAIKPASAGFTVSREYSLLAREKVKGAWVYTKRPYRGTVKSGEEIFVKVKVRPDSRYDYFMLEDPLPAGCEVITETSGYVIPGEAGYSAPNNDGYYRSFAPWNWWYADRDVRDEKVAFFAPRIEARDYEFTYILRAQIPGDYSVMPSVGALMYYPEVRGNSGLIAMKIVE